MANNRFIETACEILDIKSPDDIRYEELQKLLKEHFGDANDSHYSETEGGIIYHTIFDSDEEE